MNSEQLRVRVDEGKSMQSIHVVAKPIGPVYSLNCEFDSPSKSGEVTHNHIGGKSRDGASNKKGGTE